MSNAVGITKEVFDSEVIGSSTPVLVDFWAPWCGPCKMLGPILDQIAAEATNVKVCKVNVDEQPELATRFGVTNIPTLILFKDGNAVETMTGFRPKESIMEMLSK